MVNKLSKKLSIFFIVLLLISVFSSGCFNLKANSDGETVTITDMTGREVDVPKNIDEIVGVGAGALRLLVYMDASEMVKGVEQFEKDDGLRPYIMANPELQKKNSIGPQHGGDKELLRDLNPDVIFCTQEGKGDASDLQKQTGVPVVALRYGDLDDDRDIFYEALDTVGEVLNRTERSKKIQNFIDNTISDLDKRTDDISEETKTSCYVGGIGYKGSRGIKSTYTDYAPFEFINAKNVAGGLESEHASVNPEKIIDWNPETLFIDEGGYELVMEDIDNNEIYKNIDAVKNSETYAVLPFNYYSTNYGTVLADAYYIGTILYPERFDDVNPEEMADKIYRKLVGEGVYDDMEDDFGGFEKIDLKE